MKLEVLGTGCAKCKTLYEYTQQALAMRGIQAELVKVEDIPTIMRYGVMTTPALVKDGKLLFSGRLATPDEIAGML